MITIKLNKDTKNLSLKIINKNIKLSVNKSNISLKQTGRKGEPGLGFPTGGDTGQVLAKASDANYDTEWVEQSGSGAGITINGFDLTEDDRKLQYQPGIIETNNGEEHFSIQANHLGGYTETEGYDLGGYIMGGYTAEGGYSLSQVDLRMRDVTLTPRASGVIATEAWVESQIPEVPVTSVNGRTGDVTGLAEQALLDMVEEELFQDITTGLETKVNKSGDTMTGGLTINNGVGSIALDYLSPNEPALFMNGVFRLLYAAGYGMLFNVNGGDNLEIRIGNDPYNSLLFNNEKNLVVGFANGVPVTSDKLQVRGSGRFEGTVQGSNATASNHFVTKSQLDSSINTTTGFKYIGATEPDTTDWAVNDLWYDTSTEVS